MVLGGPSFLPLSSLLSSTISATGAESESELSVTSESVEVEGEWSRTTKLLPELVEEGLVEASLEPRVRDLDLVVIEYDGGGDESEELSTL